MTAGRWSSERVGETQEAAIADARAVARDFGEEPGVEDRLHADPPLDAELHADGRFPSGLHTLADVDIHHAERVGLPCAARRGVETDRGREAVPALLRPGAPDVGHAEIH